MILDICTHFKSTETFQCTHFSSRHPPGVRKGLTKGLSANSKLASPCERLPQQSIVERITSEVKFSERKSALQQRERVRKNSAFHNNVPPSCAIAKKNIQTHQHVQMSRVWPVNTLFHTCDRCFFILVDSRLKISLDKKSRQSQAESSDFILNPAHPDDQTLPTYDVILLV